MFVQHEYILKFFNVRVLLKLTRYEFGIFSDRISYFGPKT